MEAQPDLAVAAGRDVASELRRPSASTVPAPCRRPRPCVGRRGCADHFELSDGRTSRRRRRSSAAACRAGRQADARRLKYVRTKCLRPARGRGLDRKRVICKAATRRPVIFSRSLQHASWSVVGVVAEASTAPSGCTASDAPAVELTLVGVVAFTHRGDSILHAACALSISGSFAAARLRRPWRSSDGTRRVRCSASLVTSSRAARCRR